MKKILGTALLFLFSWTICIFASSDNPHTGYLGSDNQIVIVKNEILVQYHDEWIAVDSIRRDDTGIFFTIEKE